MASETELGISRHVTVRKCGCKYRSEDDPVVRAGRELGGYLVSACQKHTPGPSAMASETNEWPKRTDGSNMTIGEMSPEDRRAQMSASNVRVMNPVRCSACKTDGFQYTCEDCWAEAVQS